MQALAGLIASLARRPDATGVQHYVPLTAFSRSCRVYSGIRACHFAFLSPGLPDSLYVCFPGKAASDMWWSMQLMIEASFSEGNLVRYGL